MGVFRLPPHRGAGHLHTHVLLVRNCLVPFRKTWLSSHQALGLLGLRPSEARAAFGGKEGMQRGEPVGSGKGRGQLGVAGPTGKRAALGHTGLGSRAGPSTDGPGALARSPFSTCQHS